MNHYQAIRKAMQQRVSADRNIPKYVQDKAEFFEKEKGYEPGYAFSTAWSIYCKYKNPGDKVHCKKEPSEYFSKKAGAVKNMIMDVIFDAIEYVEKFSRTSIDEDGEVFDLTQEYVMDGFSSMTEARLERLLKQKGVSSTIIHNYMNKIQHELQEI